MMGNTGSASVPKDGSQEGANRKRNQPEPSGDDRPNGGSGAEQDENDLLEDATPESRKKRKLNQDDEEGDDEDLIDADQDSSKDTDIPEEEEDDSSEEEMQLQRAKANSMPSLDFDFNFQVLSGPEIVQYMSICIDEANVILQLPPTTMRILLNHFNWNGDKLLEAYYGGNQDKLFQDACVMNPTCADNLQINDGDGSEEDCEICYMQYPPSLLYGLACGHRFCAQCWDDYLTSKIMNEGVCQSIACAAHKCPILVDDATVMRLVTNAQVKLKYELLIANNFVESNRLMRWCPSPGCGKAIRVDRKLPRAVTCTCSHTFCFCCGEDWHSPIDCTYLKKWVEKVGGSSESIKYMLAHTKDCPKCKSPIEKNGGCHMMTCGKCRYQFCWMCLGNWNTHGDHFTCNRYDSSGAVAARTAQEVSRAALNRYMHYYNRYMDHMQSLKMEEKLEMTISSKQAEMQSYGMSWTDVRFLNEAVGVLRRCRQTLMYSYAFAFYLRQNNQSILFEDNQEKLQRATELLCQYLERDITSDNLGDIKQKVLDKTVFCEDRRMKLVEHVMEGQGNGTWDYDKQL